MATSPAVTVLLPTYNAAQWLGDAIESILRQSFTDFRLVVMDDGSNDATPTLLEGYRDSRIQVVRDKNRGLVAVLNHGLDIADSKYVARMDADDLSDQDRLRRQVAFMDSYPNIGICGTAFRIIGGRGGRVKPPTDHDEIAATLFFRSPFGHPTVMIRRSFLLHSGIRYDAAARHAEDYDFWVRARGLTRFANLPKYLLDYRMHSDQTSAEFFGPQAEAAGRIRLAQLAAMVPGATESEKRLHLRTCDGHLFENAQELTQAGEWLDFLEGANLKNRMFPPAAFGKALAAAWLHCCYRARGKRVELLRFLLRRRYSSVDVRGLRAYLGFAARLVRRA